MVAKKVSKLPTSSDYEKADRRVLIYKALIDPSFRKQLKDEPVVALGIKQIRPNIANEINKILLEVATIEQRVGGLADELLCACSVTVTGITSKTGVTTKK